MNKRVILPRSSQHKDDCSQRFAAALPYLRRARKPCASANTTAACMSRDMPGIVMAGAFCLCSWVYERPDWPRLGVSGAADTVMLVEVS